MKPYGAGKGDKERPKQVTSEEWHKRWSVAFEKHGANECGRYKKNGLSACFACDLHSICELEK